MIKPTTFFTLMAEFGTGEIPITEVGKKYFNYSEDVSKRYASENKFPFPVFKAGSGKSQWFVDIKALAEYLDKRKEEGNKNFLGEE